ncbi:MAG TPA: hypothetical protein VL001_09860 [Candidimonas sp.]|nr:hypothetical protein [Candidimonas sp.]
MIVLFIAAVLGAVVLLYYWSQMLSAARQELETQRQAAQEAEGRAQFLVSENRLLWERILLLDLPAMASERHQLAFELHLLMPYLWQSPPHPFYVNELKLKAEPLVKAINDPVVNDLWRQGTLESINKIPLALIGQASQPGYDPRVGVVRSPDNWYPDQPLWT